MLEPVVVLRWQLVAIKKECLHQAISCGIFLNVKNEKALMPHENSGKWEKISPAKAQERFKVGDPEIDLLGEPSGKSALKERKKCLPLPLQTSLDHILHARPSHNFRVPMPIFTKIVNHKSLTHQLQQFVAQLTLAPGHNNTSFPKSPKHTWMIKTFL